MTLIAERPMRRFSLALLALLVVRCSDATGPNLEGPAFVSAVIADAPHRYGPDGLLAWVSPDGSFNIQALEPDTLSAELAIHAVGFQVGHLNGVGSYDLRRNTEPGPVSDGWYSYLSGPSLSNVQSFSTDDVHTGVVRVTAIDTVRHLMTGTFEFEAAEYNGTGVLQVKQGAFRVPYN